MEKITISVSNQFENKPIGFHTFQLMKTAEVPIRKKGEKTKNDFGECRLQ